MIKNIFLPVLLFVASAVGAQISNISPQLVSPAGGDGMASGTYYDWSVGEPIVLFGGTACDTIFSGFQHCAIDTLRIKKTTASAGGPTTFCDKKNVILSAPAGASYLWSTTATTQTVSITATGTYTVRVINSCGDTIFSKPIVVTVIVPSVPTICLITVDSTSTKNKIVWEKPATNNIDSFIVYRKSAVFTRIGALPFSALSIYVDSSAGINPKVQAYEYALSVVDTCGNESALSSSHITIHQATPQFTPPATFDLAWTDYAGFTFSYYYILRDNNNNGNWVKIDSVPFSLSNQYTDIGVNHPLPTDSARYIIEAAPLQACNATIKNPNPEAVTVKSSKSNGSEKIIAGAVAENMKNEWVIIFPNPSNGIFTVASSTQAIESIRIFNTLGEQVYHKNVNAKKTDITLPEIAKGVYHLQITSEGSVINKKIVIE